MPNIHLCKIHVTLGRKKLLTCLKKKKKSPNYGLKKESRRKWVMGKISGKFHMKRKPMSNFIEFSMLSCHPPLSFFFPRGLMEEDRPQNICIYPAIRGRTKQRIDHSMLWCPEDFSVASLYSWKIKKVLRQELASTNSKTTNQIAKISKHIK